MPHPQHGQSRRPTIGGNWKMNTDLASACELADNIAAGCGSVIERCDVAVFPPFPYLQAVGRTLGHSGILLGAQDVYHQPDGAFTGEVSTTMLADLNVAAVLIGHSERRHIIGEDDDLVNAKLLAAMGASLRVVLCIGEKLEQRHAGATDEVNARQLTSGLRGVGREQLRSVTIAYEPVWAIGTGRTASPADAQAAHRSIRKALGTLYDERSAAAARIQYGGSVNARNAPDLIAQPDVDGFLVGGASLKPDEFVAIVKAAAAAW